MSRLDRAFLARYDGPCAADCGRSIRADDPVRYVDDELMHAECAALEDSGSPPPRPSAICPSCWTIHAGECL